MCSNEAGEGGKPLFAMGKILGTPGAINLLADCGLAPITILRRHVTGDWGDLCEEDRAANAAALEYGQRVFSSYPVAPGKKIWVITEANRAVTTILLPEDY